MRFDQRTLIVGLCISAAACRGTTEASESPELDANRRLWANQKLSRYEFTYDRLCFCAPIGPLRLSVRDGNVVGATVIATGASIDPGGLPTVDSLFAIVENGIANHFDEIRAKYDPATGYPTEIYSNRSNQIADDELTVTAKDLTPAK